VCLELQRLSKIDQNNYRRASLLICWNSVLLSARPAALRQFADAWNWFAGPQDGPSGQTRWAVVVVCVDSPGTYLLHCATVSKKWETSKKWEKVVPYLCLQNKRVKKRSVAKGDLFSPAHWHQLIFVGGVKVSTPLKSNDWTLVLIRLCAMLSWIQI